MYLKRIEMQGFKSFADKTILDFGQGVTAVVGPNGSGKSNISDAIRWVLGEMSAKSLRGVNMQDVIFSGTQIRKAVNFAEVSLVLDNSDNTFPIEFNEVVVTRRVFRSGETSYQINKANCRLKDIHELFMDTGLGRDGYSIIGQGNVSQILSTKAEDRRGLFEEAAGVSKYKHRKEESQRKLENVNENLVRINDILVELEAQLKPLELQSEKARKYLVLYEEYKALDINMILANLDNGKVQLAEIEKQYQSVNGELSDMRSKESEIEEKLNNLYTQSKQKDEEQTDKNNQLIENETKNMSISNEVSIAQTNIKNNNSLILRIDDEIENINKKNIEKTEQIKELKQEIQKDETEVSILLKSFDDIHIDNQNITESLNKYREKIDNLKADVIELMNTISSEKARINGIDNLRKNFLERKQVVESELISHGQSVEDTKCQIDSNKKLGDDIKQKLDKMNERVDNQHRAEENIKNELAKVQNEFNSLSIDYNSKASKKRMLEDMENDYEGYSKSVKMVLKSQELKHLSIYGTLSGLINVKSDYITAIEIALGGALQNIVVESEDDAKEAIAYLRNTKSGRATFLPISSVQGRKIENEKDVSRFSGFIGVASDLISYDKKYDGIIKNLLGRVVIVDNIDNAIEISRKFGYKFRVVTLDGDVLNSGGSMSGGSVNKTSGFLSRVSEIKTLSQEIVKISEKVKQLKLKKEQLDDENKNIQSQMSSYMPLIREYEDEILRLENTSIHLKQSLENSDRTQVSLQNEMREIDEQLLNTNDDISVLINSVRQKERLSDSKQQDIKLLEEEQAVILIKKEKINNEIMDKTLKIRSIEKDVSLAKEKVSSTQDNILQATQDIANKSNDKSRINQENESLKQEIALKSKLMEEIKSYSIEIKTQIETIEKQKTQIVENLKSIQGSNKEITDKLMLLQQELTRVESKKVKINIEQENILNRLWDDYELTYTTAIEFKKEIDNEKELSKYLQELKSKIKSLGSVNMESIEEYKNVKERFEFLTKQKDDLDKAKDNLNKLIDSMQELMEENFSKQFEIINKSFSEVFVELFGGGRGRLYLSNPDDVLESGIEIEVQLPGKGLQNISLYSGGEKSFIAIALLFAILNVKPTPFCILDEIDAALDDVNISRFATYLKNYLAQTQFIVITHRRGTMESANLMYGVTMQDKGVSKLLSLQIDDVDDEMVN